MPTPCVYCLARTCLSGREQAMPWIAEKSTRPTSASRVTARLRRITAAQGANKSATWGGATLAILCCVLAVFDASPVSAQSSNAPRVSCIVNESGDGWVCATGTGFTRADPRVNSSRQSGFGRNLDPCKNAQQRQPCSPRLGRPRGDDSCTARRAPQRLLRWFCRPPD